MPHLHWVQPQPPFSAAISMPPELALWVAVAETRRVAPAASASGYMLQPPQPLPHLQAVPQPQFPPQQDILGSVGASEMERL